MSVEKFSVTKECSGFTTVPNKVLQNLLNLEALGLWVSMASRPSDWIFQKKQIQAMFNIGRDKLFKLFSILKNHNLLEIRSIKNEKGQIAHWHVHLKNGNDFIQNTEIQESGKTTLLKNQSLDSSTLQKKEKPIQKKEYILPEWLSVQDWNDFTEHRKHIKAPLSDNAKKRMITSLQKLKDSGANISDVINQSIINGWKDIFPIRTQNTKGNSHANKRKSNAAIHFDSCKGSLEGTIYDSGYKSIKDPFSSQSD